MSKTTGIVISIGVLLAVVGLSILFMGISYSNGEVRLRNAITAKQRDNTSEFDNMWKKISQTVQVTQKDRDSLKQIFIEYASARGGNAPRGGALATWISEAVPNIDSATFTNLQNILVGSRDAWTQRQKELLDMSREHNNRLDTFPSSLFVGGRPRIEVQIITSSKTEAVFQNGNDDDTNLFGD